MTERESSTHQSNSHSLQDTMGRGSYTEPRILMDSIRSPGRLLKLHQESTWSPPGVHLDLSQGSNHCALPRNPARLQVYSSWTPDGVHQDGDYTRTPDPVLPKPEQDSTYSPDGLHPCQFN